MHCLTCRFYIEEGRTAEKFIKFLNFQMLRVGLALPFILYYKVHPMNPEGSSWLGTLCWLTLGLYILLSLSQLPKNTSLQFLNIKC